VAVYVIADIEILDQKLFEETASGGALWRDPGALFIPPLLPAQRPTLRDDDALPATQEASVLPGLTEQHERAYAAFYNSTKNNEHLSARETLLVGLAAAMGLNCIPCQRFYLQECRKAGISKGDVCEVLAKVLAVSSGQKRLQFQEVLDKYTISMDDFTAKQGGAGTGTA